MKLSTSLMVILMLTSCSALPATTPARSWSRVEVTTGGGITGRGLGAFAVEADGAIVVTSSAETRCELQATEAEMERLRAAFDAARPETWKTSYVPADPCCDRIHYTLRFTSSGETVTTEWVDDPSPMPADLAAVTEAMVGGAGSLRVVYGARCR